MTSKIIIKLYFYNNLGLIAYFWNAIKPNAINPLHAIKHLKIILYKKGLFFYIIENNEMKYK